MTDPIAFTFAVLAVLVTPGPTNTLLASSGATIGIARSLPLLLAEAAGYSIGILSLGIFLSAIISAVPQARLALSCIVGVYLCLVAFKLWRVGAETTKAISFRDVFITTLFNPKAFVFAFAIVPWELPNPAPYLLGFCAVVAPVGLLWITAGAVLGKVVFEGRPAIVAKSASVALVVVSVAVVTLAFKGVALQ